MPLTFEDLNTNTMGKYSNILYRVEAWLLSFFGPWFIGTCNIFHPTYYSRPPVYIGLENIRRWISLQEAVCQFTLESISVNEIICTVNQPDFSPAFFLPFALLSDPEPGAISILEQKN